MRQLVAPLRSEPILDHIMTHIPRIWVIHRSWRLVEEWLGSGWREYQVVRTTHVIVDREADRCIVLYTRLVQGLSCDLVDACEQVWFNFSIWNHGVLDWCFNSESLHASKRLGCELESVTWKVFIALSHSINISASRCRALISIVDHNGVSMLTCDLILVNGTIGSIRPRVSFIKLNRLLLNSTTVQC